jgi:hypothetical protein
MIPLFCIVRFGPEVARGSKKGTRVVDTSAHCVGLGGSGLVARTPGGAGRAHVSDLDLMSAGPAVALLVPGGFD